MRLVRYGTDPLEFDARTALTVGTFDGVHCGHSGIVERMKDCAKANNERTVVVTFDPHPQIVLSKPNREPVRLLTSIEERCDLLKQQGVDVVVVIPFTTEFAATPAEVFIRSVIVDSIGVQHFFIGHNHSFGKDRGGDEVLLQHLSAEIGFEVVPVPPLECNGVVVSSTKIRSAVAEGNVEEAEALLGRPYSVRGTVVHGAGRGRALRIPTANIMPQDSNKLLPGNGVYAVSLTVDGKSMLGAANIGLRPMFTDDTVPTLEVHILDFDGDLYSTTVDVAFHARLRDEMNYSTVDELLAQIEIDKQQTRNYQQLITERSIT